jgi:hypothetical protein
MAKLGVDIDGQRHTRAFRVCRKEIAGRERGQIAIAVRKPLLYYFNKRLPLDVAKAFDDAKENPVVVLNEKAFKDVLAEVG